MRFGVALWTARTDWPSMRDAALLAEASGFDSLWLDDHLLVDEGDWTADKLEGWVSLAAIAPLTRRVTLGHLVTANTFRNPGLLAKMAVTLDHVSGGRAVLGIGAGWFEREHRAFGIDFGRSAGERLDRLGEALPILRDLLDGARLDAEGPTYHLADAIARPRPVQAHLPILIGGMGPRRTLPLVARHADAWNASGTPADVAAAAAILDERCGEIGRDPATIERSVFLNVVVRDSEAAAEATWATTLERHAPQPGEDRLEAWGPPETVARQLRAYADVGVGTVMFVLRTPWDVETIARLDEARAALAG
jgi:F420-dependent oxidoreductase-like protein